MKEIISAIVIIASIIGGTTALRKLHDVVRTAALEKAAKGMPSLTEMTRSLQNNSN